MFSLHLCQFISDTLVEVGMGVGMCGCLSLYPATEWPQVFSAFAQCVSHFDPK